MNEPIISYRWPHPRAAVSIRNSRNAMKLPGSQRFNAVFSKSPSAYHRTLRDRISAMVALSDAKQTAKWSGGNVLLDGAVNAKILKCAIWSLFSYPITNLDKFIADAGVIYQQNVYWSCEMSMLFISCSIIKLIIFVWSQSAETLPNR